jgi:hypothetical protein
MPPIDALENRWYARTTRRRRPNIGTKKAPIPKDERVFQMVQVDGNSEQISPKEAYRSTPL